LDDLGFPYFSSQPQPNPDTIFEPCFVGCTVRHLKVLGTQIVPYQGCEQKTSKLTTTVEIKNKHPTVHEKNAQLKDRFKAVTQLPQSC
jgi:hypothetical protein